MAKIGLLYTLLLSTLILNSQCLDTSRKLHVVYMGDRPSDSSSPVAAKHHSILHRVLGSASTAKESLVYSYGRSFDGFAAKLTDDEAQTISEMEGVVSVKPNRIYQLHTVRSWDFVNLTTDKLGDPLESNVIIGLLDTGVWPEHPSFSDKNFGPPPAKWKGACTSTNFTCNNKIIGARFYNSDNSSEPEDVQSPRDTEGHGTHTASTAAGVEVDASYFGLIPGVARGGLPKARIAVYKVCWAFGCTSADILKAFDDAIADGVDIISVSLGGFPDDYFDDPIAIGSFHAMKAGILTSNSAGNSGPFPVSLSNFSPWSLTVAASSIDRKFVARMQLGNGQILTGITINVFDLKAKTYPLIWGGDVANYTIGSSPDISKFCFPETMNADLVAGKIVLCERLTDASGVIEANGAGIIMFDKRRPDNPDVAFSWPLPSTYISSDDAKLVLSYIKSTAFPTATIFVGEGFKDGMAPVVVSFSSRGPSLISPDILKPDITAPGVDILAGWSPVAGSSVYDGDTQPTLFNIISGTSMSCPHASGAAAYVKSVHPTWSPAAIKSAIMTTAKVMDPSKHQDLEFSYGSGQINPAAAIDPGLVFNASEIDYVNFLCKQGYNSTTLKLVTGDSSTCSNIFPGRGWDLNYPSFSLYVLDGDKIAATFTRTVTNVGLTGANYTASIYLPADWISVKVEPSVLSFYTYGETKTFVVTVTGPAISQQPIVSGAIVWSDGKHTVRMPLAVYNYLPGAPYNLDSEDDSDTFDVPPTFKKAAGKQRPGF